KLPKPRISIRFPPARTFDIASNIALTMVSDCRCEKFWWRASSSSMIPRLVMARGPGCGLSVAPAPPRGATLAVLPGPTQFLVQQVFHREAGLFVLAAQVLLHLLALFVRLQGLDRKPDTPFFRIELDHQRVDFIADLEQRRGLVDSLRGQLGNMDEAFDAF